MQLYSIVQIHRNSSIIRSYIADIDFISCRHFIKVLIPFEYRLWQNSFGYFKSCRKFFIIYPLLKLAQSFINSILKVILNSPSAQRRLGLSYPNLPGAGRHPHFRIVKKKLTHLVIRKAHFLTPLCCNEVTRD